MNDPSTSVLGVDLRFPSRWMGAAMLLTGGLCLLLVWSELRACRFVTTTQAHYLRFVELRGAIGHLNDLMDMSALLAAATGDPKWEERYLQAEPRLDAAIQEARRQEAGPRLP